MTTKILELFSAKLDNTKDDYTLDELKKLLTEAFKECKTKKKKVDGAEKKAPSPYNIFIKEEIQRIKADKGNVDNKQLMSLAASRWKEHKALTTTSGSAAAK
jgi:hypothetical protein